MDGSHDDNVEEQADRRVEVLFFGQGQEPDVALLDEDPKVSHPDAFRRVEIDGASAKAGAFLLRTFEFFYQVNFDLDPTDSRNYFLRCVSHEVEDHAPKGDARVPEFNGTVRAARFVDVRGGEYELRERLGDSDVCVSRNLKVTKKGLFLHKTKLDDAPKKDELAQVAPGAPANNLPGLVAGSGEDRGICEHGEEVVA